MTILLSREEVNPDKPNNWGRTPLSYATMSGHEGVVKVLLRCEEVNSDNPDTDGRTPLSYAAGDGHAAVVNILLGDEKVNPTSQIIPTEPRLRTRLRKDIRMW